MVKLALCNSVQKHFPDNGLDSILRLDALQTAVSVVLLLIMPVEGGNDTYHPIGFMSKELSWSAACCDAHKREAFPEAFSGQWLRLDSKT